MIIEFSHGKLILNQHDIVVKLTHVPTVTLQAQVDALSLIGRGANVITAYDMQCQWNIQLDSEQQLDQVSEFLGIAVKQ